MRIAESTIERVRLSTNILDVVSLYVPLRSKGRNHWGLCPFHTEKTPSFSVNVDKQMFNCFGCHVGGNVFKFLMEYKKISYVEAIVELAKAAGIQIEQTEGDSRKIISEYEELYELNEEVAKVYSNTLLETKQGKAPLEYLKNRGMSLGSMRSFRVGYALPAKNFLIEKFGSSEKKINQMVDLGLLGRSDNGALYDRFQGRIIFPIFSTNGRVIGFGGRIIEPKENTGKYVNSPESKIYSKGKILYGLSHAKDDIRKLDQAIVVEGYMDLISLHQSGIKNVIAVSGTAFTDDQALLLSRYSKEVVLIFDADEAGLKASMRSVDILLRRNMNIRIASLPEGEDPDSFIRARHKDDFIYYVNKAENFLEFQTSFYDRSGGLRDPLKSTDIIRELLRPLSLIDDRLKQTRLIQSLAEKFDLRQRLLEDELGKIIRKNRNLSESQSQYQQEAKKAEAKTKVQARTKKREKLENELMQLLLEGEKDIIRLIRESINYEDLSDSRHQRLTRAVYDALDAGESVRADAIAGKFIEDDLQQFISQLSSEPYHVNEEEWEKALPLPERRLRLLKWAADVLKNIKMIEIQEETEQIKSALKDRSDMKNEKQLLARVVELREEAKMIETQYDLNEILKTMGRK
jgi:DNA primase